MDQPPRHILITGASSGIGAALARHYAAPNRRLALFGRHDQRLAELAASCRAAGADVATDLVDVRDQAQLAERVGAHDLAQPLDLVIANAGMAGNGEDGAEVLAINLLGLWATVAPAVPLMRARGHGQLGLMSSLAGFRGLPGAGTYCAAKAGARVLAESLRLDLKPYGIGVSAICPGFVATPLTSTNRFPMPWLMEPEPAAAAIARGLARNQAVIAFPWQLALIVRTIGLLPNPLAERVLARL